MSSRQEPSSQRRNPDLVYLDSAFYLDYLQGDMPYHGALKAILDAWKIGGVEVVTSALTLAEVLYVKRSTGFTMAVGRHRELDIIDLFHQYGPRRLRLVEVDRTIGELARHKFWDSGIHPKDAIHVASALRARVPVFFTNDRGLLSFSGRLGGQPTLQIEIPHWVIQNALDAAAPQSDESK